MQWMFLAAYKTQLNKELILETEIRRNHPKCSKETKRIENNKIIKRHGGKNKIPEINLHIYSQLIFNKGVKTIQWEKKSLFKKWCWDNCTGTCKSVKLDSCLSPYTIINSK